MTTLEDMAEMGGKFARDLLVGTKNDLMPMFVIKRSEGIDVIGVPFKDDEEKRVMIINVALEIVEKGADAWSFLTESWFAHRRPGEPLGPRPAQDPNRMEGVICLASDGDSTELYSWETKRDAEGNCTDLVKYGDEEGPKHFSSWISSALNRAKKLHDEFPSGGPLDIGDAVKIAKEMYAKERGKSA
jgi:hypothetical protein